MEPRRPLSLGGKMTALYVFGDLLGIAVFLYWNLLTVLSERD